MKKDSRRYIEYKVAAYAQWTERGLEWTYIMKRVYL